MAGSKRNKIKRLISPTRAVTPPPEPSMDDDALMDDLLAQLDEKDKTSKEQAATVLTEVSVQKAADAADANIVIPMFGMVQSLNVSVAAATILFEAQRQRLAAGMYAGPQLSPEELRERAFEWAYPDLAPAYRERGEAYPVLDDAGQIVA